MKNAGLPLLLLAFSMKFLFSEDSLLFAGRVESPSFPVRVSLEIRGTNGSAAFSRVNYVMFGDPEEVNVIRIKTDDPVFLSVTASMDTECDEPSKPSSIFPGYSDDLPSLDRLSYRVRLRHDAADDSWSVKEGNARHDYVLDPVSSGARFAVFELVPDTMDTPDGSDAGRIPIPLLSKRILLQIVSKDSAEIGLSRIAREGPRLVAEATFLPWIAAERPWAHATVWEDGIALSEGEVLIERHGDLDGQASASISWKSRKDATYQVLVVDHAGRSATEWFPARDGSE